jgi:hypothetical protein
MGGFMNDRALLNFSCDFDEHRHWHVAPPDEYFDELRRVSVNQIVWGGNYFGYLRANGCTWLYLLG